MATVPEDEWVLHVDLDEFLAAVEIARRPELRGRPVVVGGAGDPARRAVVATASYEAREYGIHSGMPLRTAARRCPDAVFLPSDPPAYNAVSEQAVMGERPTDALWGIGAKTAKKLAGAGIVTVAELADADPGELAQRFGPTLGPWYKVLALGAGDRTVTAEPYVPRSRSREMTFQHDLTSRADVDEQVVRLARRVAQDVRAEGRPATRVAVKVRFAPFFTHTRSVSVDPPTSDPGEIERAALAALDRVEHGRPVRLLGVRAELTPPE